MPDPYDLLDQIDAFNQANDPEGAQRLIASHPRQAEFLEAAHDLSRDAYLREHDLEGKGWMPVERAAKYLPYKPVTIRLLARKGHLGPEGTAWTRDTRWPYRMYISPEALSALHRREYRASGPRQPYKHRSNPE